MSTVRTIAKGYYKLRDAANTAKKAGKVAGYGASKVADKVLSTPTGRRTWEATKKGVLMAKGYNKRAKPLVGTKIRSAKKAALVGGTKLAKDTATMTYDTTKKNVVAEQAARNVGMSPRNQKRVSNISSAAGSLLHPLNFSGPKKMKPSRVPRGIRRK